mmetsp:Transcript_8670/g.10930  ORF Transcript_8670/g.10930 Transcript_8670/m.10930 type:complete len:162 (-) Transcript_8670:1135-1620(-)
MTRGVGGPKSHRDAGDGGPNPHRGTWDEWIKTFGNRELPTMGTPGTMTRPAIGKDWAGFWVRFDLVYRGMRLPYLFAQRSPGLDKKLHVCTCSRPFAVENFVNCLYYLNGWISSNLILERYILCEHFPVDMSFGNLSPDAVPHAEYRGPTMGAYQYRWRKV